MTELKHIHHPHYIVTIGPDPVQEMATAAQLGIINDQPEILRFVLTNTSLPQ
jgi:hypothetical protein